MIILADSDIVRNLAYCEWLLDFLQISESPPNDVFILPALKYQLRKALKDSPKALANFEAFLKRVREIPKADVRWLARLDAVGIDSGEQQIFAVLCQSSQASRVVSGDKKALNALAGVAHADPAVASALAAVDVWCFEYVLKTLLQKRGLSVGNARISQMIGSAPDRYDHGFQTAFSLASGGSNAVTFLTQRIEFLQLQCVGVPIRAL